MQYFCTESKEQNMSSTIVPTNLNTIDTLLGAAKLMKKQILPDLKLRKANYAYTLSSAQTAEVIIRQT